MINFDFNLTDWMDYIVSFQPNLEDDERTYTIIAEEDKYNMVIRVTFYRVKFVSYSIESDTLTQKTIVSFYEDKNLKKAYDIEFLDKYGNVLDLKRNIKI